MARPKGTKNIETPERMWEHFQAYKEDLKEKESEWEKVQYVGKDGDRVTDNPKLPLTFEGFKRFCWEKGIGYVEQYFVNQDKLYDDYMGVCSHIKNCIRENQITGGLLNFYNPSITQRLNGLVDQKSIDIKEQPLFGDEK